jgi:ribose transport system ATP-binding protein
MSPRKALELGLALLPANRMQDGGVMVATVAENATLPSVGRHVVHGWLSHRRETRHVRALLERFEVNPRRPDIALGSLSGGNQQKVLVGKWFDTGPSVLLLHEPTQGVDVGAKAAIFNHIRNAAESGIGVVIASSEYEDLAHICDRVMVFRGGRVASVLHGADLTHARIVEQCFTTENPGDHVSSLSPASDPMGANP